MDELVDVLTEDGNNTGTQVSKILAHKNGICHGICVVALIDKEGRILLQKRSETKRDEPNKWDFSSSGHISVGETPKEAAIRETAEEIGITINESDLKLIDTYINKVKLDSGININHYTYLFIAQININSSDIAVKKEEVSEVRFVNKEEYNKMFTNKEMVEAVKNCSRALDYIK